MNKSVILVSPFHDPNGRLTDEIIKNGRKLAEVFNNLSVASLTENTSKKTFEAINKSGINYFLLPKEIENNLGNNYRNAIKLGLETNTSHILLMDFDRSLHWVKRFPQELKKIKQELLEFFGFTSFVRSRRAFESHPMTQRSTETTINAIASEAGGMDLDIMSGAFGMDKNLAKLIINQSKRNDYGIYAELLEIALKNKVKLNRLEVEGLEWETPDQYKNEIQNQGYSKWLNDFESIPEWEKRVQLIEKSTEVLTGKDSVNS